MAGPVVRSRPFGVTLLAIFAGIAAVVNFFHALQLFHILPVGLFGGAVRFFTFDFWGGLMFAILGLIYLWVARMLWNLDAQGWLFVVVIAVLNLIMAVMAILGQSSWQELGLYILINAIVLIYGLLPGTKAAFNMQAPTSRQV